MSEVQHWKKVIIGVIWKMYQKKLRTYKICLAAVKQSWCALEHVPDDIRTYELCLYAVKQKWLAMINVQKRHKTVELCKATVNQTWLA
jgi:hypothetical protein